ncbi:unnamed protein product [Urochloa humidicola]
MGAGGRRFGEGGRHGSIRASPPSILLAEGEEAAAPAPPCRRRQRAPAPSRFEKPPRRIGRDRGAGEKDRRYPAPSWTPAAWNGIESGGAPSRSPGGGRGLLSQAAGEEGKREMEASTAGGPLRGADAGGRRAPRPRREPGSSACRCASQVTFLLGRRSRARPPLPRLARRKRPAGELVWPPGRERIEERGSRGEDRGERERREGEVKKF